MLQPLIHVDLQNIYLVGCDFDIEVSHQDEQLKITLDGGYSGSKDIVYFELNFKYVGCAYYENDEMWPEQLSLKYDLSAVEKNRYRGVFKCDQHNEYDQAKIKGFDPLNRLDMVRFLVIGQKCFCEFIAHQHFSIKELHTTSLP